MSEKVNKYWFEEQQKLKKEAALQKLAPVRDVFFFQYSGGAGYLPVPSPRFLSSGRVVVSQN